MAILATHQATTEPGLDVSFPGFLQSLSSASFEVPLCDLPYIVEIGIGARHSDQAHVGIHSLLTVISATFGGWSLIDRVMLGPVSSEHSRGWFPICPTQIFKSLTTCVQHCDLVGYVGIQFCIELSVSVPVRINSIVLHFFETK